MIFCRKCRELEATPIILQNKITITQNIIMTHVQILKSYTESMIPPEYENMKTTRSLLN